MVNSAIGGIFNSGSAQTIDFMTNLPFLEIWSHTRLVRVRLFLSKGFVLNLFRSVTQNTALRKSMARLVPSRLLFLIVL